MTTQTKSFWVLFTILSFGAFWLPIGWGIVETLVALVASWWVIYRTGLSETVPRKRIEEAKKAWSVRSRRHIAVHAGRR